MWCSFSIRRVFHYQIFGKSKSPKFTCYYMRLTSSSSYDNENSILYVSVGFIGSGAVCEFRFYRFIPTSVSDCEDVMTALWSLLPKWPRTQNVIMLVDVRQRVPFESVAFALIAFFADNFNVCLSRLWITYVRTHSTKAIKVKIELAGNTLNIRRIDEHWNHYLFTGK